MKRLWEGRGGPRKRMELAPLGAQEGFEVVEVRLWSVWMAFWILESIGWEGFLLFRSFFFARSALLRWFLVLLALTLPVVGIWEELERFRTWRNKGYDRRLKISWRSGPCIKVTIHGKIHLPVWFSEPFSCGGLINASNHLKFLHFLCLCHLLVRCLLARRRKILRNVMNFWWWLVTKNNFLKSVEKVEVSVRKLSEVFFFFLDLIYWRWHWSNNPSKEVVSI